MEKGKGFARVMPSFSSGKVKPSKRKIESDEKSEILAIIEDTEPKIISSKESITPHPPKQRSRLAKRFV